MIDPIDPITRMPNQNGEPVTPVLTYADRHAGTGRYVARLRGLLQKQGKAKDKTKAGSSSGSGGVDSIYEATGAPMHTAYAAAQLWRLAEEEPVGGWVGWGMLGVVGWQTIRGPLTLIGIWPYNSIQSNPTIRR